MMMMIERPKHFGLNNTYRIPIDRFPTREKFLVLLVSALRRIVLFHVVVNRVWTSEWPDFAGHLDG